VKLDSVSK